MMAERIHFRRSAKHVAEWSRRRRVEILLFVLLWTSYAYFYQATGDNEAARLDQIRALVDDGTLKIDKYWWNSADIIHYPAEGGAVYPNKAPGLTFLFAPAYVVVSRLLGPIRALGMPEWIYWHVLTYLLTLCTIGLLSALAAVATYHVLVEMSGDRGASLFGVVAIWLGTLVFPFSTLFFSHVPTAALVTLAFCSLFRLRRSDGTMTRTRLVGACVVGLLMSWSVASEYPAALAAGTLSIYAIWVAWRWKISRQDKLIFAVAWLFGLTIGAAILIGYNLAAFGRPFYVPYESYSKVGAYFYATYSHGWMGLQWLSLGHFWTALAAITIRPPIGLLYFKIDNWRVYACNPVLWAALPGLAIMCRKREWRAETVVIVAITVAYLLLLTHYGSSIYDWSGASYLGPRHLIPMLPLLALPIGFAARKLWWLTCPLLALSIFYMLIATAIEPRVPFPFEIPARDLLLPDYLHGEFAHNTHWLFDSGQHLITSDSTAFNLAKLFGMPRHYQLVPLMGWWGLLGSALIFAVHKGEASRLKHRSVTFATAALLLFVSAIAFAPTIAHHLTTPRNTGHGLLGKYYRNTNWSGTPVDEQVDPRIDFDWSKSMPLPPPFSVEWSGKLLVEQPGQYQLAIIADDGALLEIDGRTVIDARNVLLQEKTASLQLNAGSHPIRLRYFNALFGGSVRLWWTLTGRPRQIIPTDAFIPNPTPTATSR